MPLGLFLFFGGHLPQTSSFRSAKEILVMSFATHTRAFILSDRNIFYTPGGGRTTVGSNAPGAFLVFFLLLVTCPRPPVFALPNEYSSRLFAIQVRVRILSDRNIFCTLGEEGRDKNGGV